MILFTCNDSAAVIAVQVASVLFQTLQLGPVQTLSLPEWTFFGCLDEMD